MKVVYNAEPFGYSEAAVEKWADKGYSYYAGSWKEISEGNSLNDVHILIVRLRNKVTDAVLDTFPNLRFLVTATTGLDHIDLDAAEQRNVTVISLRPHKEFLKTIPSTAEHTWGLIMSLLRNIPQSHQHVINGGWNRDEFRGYQLSGKTIGLVGLGRTGSKVAKYATAFDMKVCYYDPYFTSEHHYLRMNSLTGLVSESDIISIHVHLNQETENLLSKEILSYVKPGSCLINTSRGKVWDELAVVESLKKKVLRAVASDVLNNELDQENASPLLKYAETNKNVILTPHIGGATWDAMWACEEFICENFNEGN